MSSYRSWWSCPRSTSNDFYDDYDDDELDDDELDVVGFAEDLAEWLIGRESDRDRVHHAAWIAHVLADLRGTHQGGSPVSWTPGDVADFLLDHAPRRISFDDHSIAITPWAVAMALRKAGEEHLLPNAARLASYAESLQKKLLERARDPLAWGMAKTLAMQMRADGIDMEDGGAVDAWIAAFTSDRSISGPRRRRCPPTTRPARGPPAPASRPPGDATVGRAAAEPPRAVSSP